MIKRLQLKVIPEKINDMDFIHALVLKKSRLDQKKLTDWQIVKKSIDARKGAPFFLVQIDLYVNETKEAKSSIIESYVDVSKAKEVVIIGAGPAGYFAALELIELGLRPIILERGKDVRDRRRDLKAIQQDGVVNPNSNYCFGEGGAGTYSDGKLYTRSHKRGKIAKVLQLLVEHGASEDILIDAHPHIGSNKLPKIIANIRQTIEGFGGKILFDHQVVDFDFDSEKVKQIQTLENGTVRTDHLILATGHSARDIFYALDKKEIFIEAKPFALGVRIEHPQSIIDEVQYRQKPRSEFLPASSYSLTAQINNKGVFSFCMCPGGLIVPAATAPGEIVVNGMSLSRRDSPFANSGVVTSIELDELHENGYEGVFASLDFQCDVEQHFFHAGDGSQKAPAQRMTDFINRQYSPTLNSTSYIPGLHSARVDELLPNFVSNRIAKGLLHFGKRMNSYLTSEANVVGVESRTSSPIRIPRDKETCQHVQIKNLYPCGEGAGYAGGILSAAMDGQKVAKAVASNT